MNKKSKLLPILSLTAISALIYLPLLNQFGYTNDDWYLMSAARMEGANIFWSIFSGDRPYRALIMIPAYFLFGENPLWYNLSAYGFRLVGALALFWILNMIWVERKNTNTITALLFLIYPGFLSMPNGIDYQSHVVGLATALFSVAFTVYAVLHEGQVIKIIAHVLSILLGWLYLSQMEWYIGFELFRWASVSLLSWRLGGTLLQKGWRTIKWAYPSIAAPGLFLIWRIFFFESERGATDVNIQFEQALLHPLQILYHWGVQVIQDFFDVTIAAWVIPLSQLTGYIQRWGGVLVIAVTALIVLYVHKIQKNESHVGSLKAEPEHEALLLGILTAIGGLIPIAMVNRDVLFPFFSRYSLVSSVGVAILITSILMNLKTPLIRNSLLGSLCLIAILTHHANAVKAAQATAATNAFWWQVAWRVPQLEPNTTLIAIYPGTILEEDYFIWGPANLIYYPENQSKKETFIQPYLYALLLNSDTLTKLVADENPKYDKRRGIVTYPNHRNALILSQPTPASCVHILNGATPEYSSQESDAIRLIGSHSEIERVLINETPHTPPVIIFGPEPVHDWCYYFQTADLARQKGNWDQVVKIGEQAFTLGLSPTDMIEWMPFIQAYAILENKERLQELAPILSADPGLLMHVCQISTSMSGLSSDIQTTINELYCPK